MMVKHPADHDGVVRGIVMAEAMARMARAPGKPRPREQATKELPIELLEEQEEAAKHKKPAKQ